MYRRILCRLCSCRYVQQQEDRLPRAGEYVLFDQESDRSGQRQGRSREIARDSVSCENDAEKGYNVGILDADITGPSIPKMYGVHTKAAATAENNILPCTAKDGTKIMSVNLLLEDESAPVIWRGPIIASVVKQFWTDVMWGDLDYLFVDMPPGTGDVPLTVFQSLPVDGVVIVTSPQDLVQMIVKKAANMAEQMNIRCSASWRTTAM